MSDYAQEIWLIRHGETEWSQSGKHTGRTDVPLNEAGRQHALAIGKALAERSFALVLTSPLSRARETCVLAGYGDRAEVLEDLAEWDYGIFEGRKTWDIRSERPNWSIWDSEVREGESIEQVAARAKRVLGVASTAAADVAIFSHGHFLRIFSACWIELPPRSGRRLALDTGSISVLGYERETRVIRAWNNCV